MLSDVVQWNYRGRSCSNIQGIIASLPEEQWKAELAKVAQSKLKRVRDHLITCFQLVHG